MKIGLLSPSIYMSPTKYKDMIFAPRDLVVALADGLVGRGHEVFLFSSPDIQTRARLVPGDEKILFNDYIEDKMKNASSDRLKWASFYAEKRNYEIDLTMRCYHMAKNNELDIIHSYHDHMAHFFDELSSCPTVYTLHDPIPQNKKSLFYWLLQKFSSHKYISISDAYRRGDSIGLNFIGTVYHGIASDQYEPSYMPGKYIACMGRMIPEKGIDIGINVARIAHIPIQIATSSMAENKNLGYFTNVVEPLAAEENVDFVGFMDAFGKSNFFNSAICFLFPIQWEEPFGLVMVEAMACGTPVVAYNRGSVPEIVRDGVTGFIIDPDEENRPRKGSWIIKKQGIDGLAEAIKRIGEIDRSACRKYVEEHFTIKKMVEGYEQVYRKVLPTKG